MIEQLNNAVTFRAFYTNSGSAATGLTVTIDVYNPAGTKVVTAASASEIGTSGIYEYELASGSVTTEGLYTAIFTTAGTVDQADIGAQWHVGVAGVENLDAAITTRLDGTDYTAARAAKLDNLDATVSSRVDSAVWTNAKAAFIDAAISSIPTVNDIWSEPIAGYSSGDTMGSIQFNIFPRLDALATNQSTLGGLIAAVASDVWDELTASHITAGTFGKFLQDLDASIGQNIGAVTVTPRLPVESESEITIRVGDDYLTANGRAFVWTFTSRADLVGATASFAVNGIRIATGTVVDSGLDGDGNTTETLTVEVLDTESVLLAGSEGLKKRFSVQLTESGSLLTEISGIAKVLPTHPQA